MLVVTGAAGFIGSCLVGKLNELGYNELVLVDDFSSSIKNKNLEEKKYFKKIDRIDFIPWFKRNYNFIDTVYHIGARTNTAEFDIELLTQLNLEYSKELWSICSLHSIPFIYASSAATYGLGEFGFDDSHDIIKKLKPLNPYGDSKNEFDKWVLLQESTPPFWAGFKFFNVYGPNEFHKQRMSSVVFNAFNQIKDKGVVRLFRSHNLEYKDGEQVRDFIYVKDVIDVLVFMMKGKAERGIYNLGTGHARTFKDLANAVFQAMSLAPVILFIDTPDDIRNNYQYFTQANMLKLRSAGYQKEFTSLESGVQDYVQNYLLVSKYF